MLANMRLLWLQPLPADYNHCGKAFFSSVSNVYMFTSNVNKFCYFNYRTRLFSYIKAMTLCLRSFALLGQ